MKLLALLIAAGSLALVSSSYCGQSGIPFSFEADVDGQPILGCARPACFGWAADGRRAADTAQFYRINKKADGFLRPSDTKGPVSRNASAFRPQFSMCDRGYYWDQCTGTNQWLGGIAPLASITPDSAFRVMCCTYDRLTQSVEQGTAEVKPGQAVVGGEINGKDGRQYAFEYISNIQRHFDERGQAVYSVTMKQFPCVPEPVTAEAGVEAGTAELFVNQAGARTFDSMKFDLPSNMPKEETATIASATPESSTTGYHLLPSGHIVPAAQVYPEQTDASQSQSQPIAIQQGTYQQVYQQQQTSQPQQQNPNYFQANMLDPLGIFRPQNFGLPTMAPLVFPTDYSGQNQQQQQQYNYNWYGTPGTSNSNGNANNAYGNNYNYPYQGYYDYSNANNNGNVYANNNQAVGQQVVTQPPASGAKNLPHPRPLPLKIPSVEEVEQSIPESGRRMIVNVAKTLLGL